MCPGLAFFEAGMLRSKNTLSVVVQIFAGNVILSVMWLAFGFALSFGPTVGGLIGAPVHPFWVGVHYDKCGAHAENIPGALFALFQMMFAAITPLLMTGSFAERFKWKCFVVFIILWEFFIYYPVCHWIWGGGFLHKWGVIDFAGGIVIHVSTGMF
jgi:Amt family ammonium transporter